MSICIKDQIQNMNIVIGCTVGCTNWNFDKKVFVEFSHLSPVMK